ncbi:MAG: gamma-glutamyl-gamma-aminobutyrate hydrolase family protein [Chloroflexi bacterium]|nr:gamma-glutamyl-gamma-aminobutyrate hydrolase family protein [Chloroflexota bacterium]
MAFRPLIGITTGYRAPANDREVPTYTSYVAVANNVANAGGLPVLIPNGVDDETLRGIFERLDGILLPGGGDIDSKHWGEALHETAYGLDPSRDHVEMTLARWAVSEDTPVFGICRGHQVFNVALGAPMIQDIPSQYTSELTHNNFMPTPRSHLAHVVAIEPNSRLAAIVGQSNAVPVNSIHHQAVRTAAPGLNVAAVAPDGLIEATELPGKRFALTVQWHPEDLSSDERMFNLFREFVRAAKNGN